MRTRRDCDITRAVAVAKRGLVTENDGKQKLGYSLRCAGYRGATAETGHLQAALRKLKSGVQR